MLIIFLGSLLLNAQAQPKPAPTPVPISILTEKLYLDFMSIRRIKLQGPVVETTDQSALGGTISFMQSLHYTGQVTRAFNQTFKDAATLMAFLKTTLCEEKVAVTMKPYREQGAQADESYLSELKPSFVRVVGLTQEKTPKKFDQLVSCRN